LSSHPIDNFSKILHDLNVIKSSEILEKSKELIKRNIQLCGLVFKIQKRYSNRGKWANFQLNDLGGNCEVALYSDTYAKYEELLVEQKLILLDVEIKVDLNQGFRIIAKRLRFLHEYLAEKKLNLNLFVEHKSSIIKIETILKKVNIGNSNVLLNFSIGKQSVKIKIKENVKLSSELLNDISKINGIKNISYS
jgi:DNA polymerase III subunit alpha